MMRGIKRYISRGMAVMWLIVSATIAANAADVNFSIEMPRVEKGMTLEAARIVYDKTEQILTRNSAAAAGDADVFVVEPVMSIGATASSAGMVRDVTTISGELTLVAKNAVDGAKYYSVTIPLSTTLKSLTSGGEATALAKSIKPTDPVYTRFVRTARQKISQYYEDHCDEIISRARTMALAGLEVQAAVYLLGVPASAPCADEATALIVAIRQAVSKPEEGENAPDETAPDNANIPECQPDGDGSDVNPAPSSEDVCKNDSKIFIEDPDWKFKILSTSYNSTSRRVEITAEVEYVGRSDMHDASVRFVNAINAEGERLSDCDLEGGNWKDFPENVSRKIKFYISGVREKPTILKYLEFKIDYKKIEVRDLRID